MKSRYTPGVPNLNLDDSLGESVCPGDPYAYVYKNDPTELVPPDQIENITMRRDPKPSGSRSDYLYMHNDREVVPKLLVVLNKNRNKYKDCYLTYSGKVVREGDLPGEFSHHKIQELMDKELIYPRSRFYQKILVNNATGRIIPLSDYKKTDVLLTSIHRANFISMLKKQETVSVKNTSKPAAINQTTQSTSSSKPKRQNSFNQSNDTTYSATASHRGIFSTTQMTSNNHTQNFQLPEYTLAWVPTSFFSNPLYANQILPVDLNILRDQLMGQHLQDDNESILSADFLSSSTPIQPDDVPQEERSPKRAKKS